MAEKNGATPARLQFWDVKMNRASVEALNVLDMDTYLGEVKFENTINPLSGEANPRQIERVPAGSVFDFQLVYNISDVEQVGEDMQTLADGMKLLTWDYLGGSGSRGYGRLSFSNWDVQEVLTSSEGSSFTDDALRILKEV